MVESEHPLRPLPLPQPLDPRVALLGEKDVDQRYIAGLEQSLEVTAVHSLVGALDSLVTGG